MKRSILEADNRDKKVRKLDKQIAATDLREEQRLISELSERGAKVWRQLSDKRKFEKDILLAVFGSDDIPNELKVSNWDSNAQADLLKDDREILIARASTTTSDDRLEESPYFSIPEAFLGDLDVLQAVAKPSPRSLLHPDIHETMFDDDELFQVLVDRETVKNTDADYRESMEAVLERFSARIRGNAEFMHQAAAIGLNIFPYIDGDLRDDKDFYLKLAEKLRVPDDVLNHLSDALRNDDDIFCCLLEKNVSILEHCNEDDRKRFSGNKNLVKRFCEKRSELDYKFSDLYAMLDEQLKLDWEIIVAAREGNCFDVSHLPEELSQDPNFWKYALGKCSLFWNDLPDAFKRDISFARCITGFHYDDIVMEVMTVHPALITDADYWRDAILRSTTYVTVYIGDLVAELGVRNNRALMLVVCSLADQVLPSLPLEFQRDREFVEITVESNDTALDYFPHEAQQLYPDLVAKAISQYPDPLGHIDPADKNPAIWSNRAVAEAWFRKQGPIHHLIPAQLKEDPNYCLLIMEHCTHQEATEFVSRRLRSSKDFMLRAIEKNPVAYLLVLESVKLDYDAALVGFGAYHSDALVDQMMSDLHAFPYLPSFLREVQLKLRTHDSLVTLLCGMSSVSGDECPLSKLQQGQETSLVWKRCIADYLGCPIGAELAQHRRAASALQRIQPLWMDSD